MVCYRFSTKLNRSCMMKSSRTKYVLIVHKTIRKLMCLGVIQNEIYF